MGHAARRDRRRDPDLRAPRRLLRGRHRQRVGHGGDGRARRILLEDSAGSAPPDAEVRDDVRAITPVRPASPGCTTTGRRSSPRPPSPSTSSTCRRLRPTSVGRCCGSRTTSRRAGGGSTAATSSSSIALNAFRTFGVTVYHEMEDTCCGDSSAIQRDVPNVVIMESPVYYHTDHDGRTWCRRPGSKPPAAPTRRSSTRSTRWSGATCYTERRTSTANGKQ